MAVLGCKRPMSLHIGRDHVSIEWNITVKVIDIDGGGYDMC